MLSNKRRREGADAGPTAYESDPDAPPSVAGAAAAAAPALAAAASAEDPALSAEQQAVLRAVRLGDNIFLTGSAGVGKSVTLRAIIRTLGELYGPEHVAVCASTGIAAEPLGGSTLHSFAGCGMGEYCELSCRRPPALSEALPHCAPRPCRPQLPEHPQQGQPQPDHQVRRPRH